MSVGTPAISLTLQLAVNNTVSLYNVSIIAAAGNAASLQQLGMMHQTHAMQLLEDQLMQVCGHHSD